MRIYKPGTCMILLLGYSRGERSPRPFACAASTVLYNFVNETLCEHLFFFFYPDKKPFWLKVSRYSCTYLRALLSVFPSPLVFCPLNVTSYVLRAHSHRTQTVFAFRRLRLPAAKTRLEGHAVEHLAKPQ